jgi:hypothetical protein
LLCSCCVLPCCFFSPLRSLTSALNPSSCTLLPSSHFFPSSLSPLSIPLFVPFSHLSPLCTLPFVLSDFFLPVFSIPLFVLAFLFLTSLPHCLSTRSSCIVCPHCMLSLCCLCA